MVNPYLSSNLSLSRQIHTRPEISSNSIASSFIANYHTSDKPLSVNTVLAYAPLLSIIAHSFRLGSVCTRPTTDSIVVAATNFDRFRFL